MPNTFSDVDLTMMRYALSLAEKGVYSTPPNPAVGCVLVKEQHIIGEGWHRKAGEPHAEKLALANATQSVEQSTAYVTLEPCSHFGRTPPCADALVDAKVARVVVAMQDPNPLVSGQGVKRLRDAGIQVDVGLLAEDAEKLNCGFFHSMATGLPYVRLKMATSLDGRTAMQNGDSVWITGAKARETVHFMRARHAAVVTGIGTVLKDDPSLTVRLSASQLTDMGLTEEEAQPIRVVLDSQLQMPVDAKMLSLSGRTLVMTLQSSADQHAAKVQALLEQGAEVISLKAAGKQLDLQAVLKYLHDIEQVYDVMIEAGAKLAGSFIQAGYVNEVHLFMAPSLMGNLAKPTFFLPGLVEMSDKMPLKYDSVAQVGDDLHLVLSFQNNHLEGK